MSHRCRVCDSKLKRWFTVSLSEKLAGMRSLSYHKCSKCHALHCVDMLDWTNDEFKKYVYNDRYIELDPEFLHKRPENNKGYLCTLFGDVKQHAIHLDYGGGNGELAKLMRSDGWDSYSYDPFYDTPYDLRDDYNLISAFEVLEHHPKPMELMSELKSRLEPYGMIVFSSAFSNNHVPYDKPGDYSWWYANPRVGHIILHSFESVEHMARELGLGCTTTADVGAIYGATIPTRRA